MNSQFQRSSIGSYVRQILPIVRRSCSPSDGHPYAPRRRIFLDIWIQIAAFASQSTLSVCASLHKEWLTMTRKILYKNVKLYGFKQVEPFIRTLRTNPILSKEVRSLSAAASASSIYLVDRRLLPNLTRIRLLACWQGLHLEHPFLSKPMSRFFPMLPEIDIDGSIEPVQLIQIISLTPNLTVLKCSNLKGVRNPSKKIRTVGCRLNILSIGVDGNQTFDLLCDIFQETGVLDELVQLSIWSTRADNDLNGSLMNRLFLTVGDTLHSLGLRCHYLSTFGQYPPLLFT